ncbi:MULTISPECIES: hypothetical protein [Streptomyces]|uniref:hypothetical protein n=1 Tax=Streptomyces TaxID=1883 RepID=UPI000B1F1A7B|nr:MULTISPECIES: hypothetical protein [Streptomyces]
MNVDRFRPAFVALAAVALAAVLTGCQEGGAAAGDGVPGASATADGPGVVEMSEAPVDEPSATGDATPGVKTPAKVPAKKTGGPKPKPRATTEAPGADCVDGPPEPEDYDPDEFALYRIEELDGSTGKVNLVIQHGAWGCGGADTDGGPFVVSGEESRWALDQAAYVTVTDPIVASTENQRIGVQELIDWVGAHPDSGLVFRYETGDDWAIHRLEQVFTP